MEYLDARRLTGPNLLWDRPGSILDVRCNADEMPAVVERWTGAVRAMLDAVGWDGEETTVHALSGGVSLAFSAPIDGLYAATEINDWAWTVIAAGTADEAPVPLADKAAGILALIEEEANPSLIALKSAALAAGASFLWDDDDASVGSGVGSTTWPVGDLPMPGDVDWTTVADVPIGIVTGTNGKTTTVRLATHICRTAGYTTGVSCTDWIAVDNRVIDRDDWSGPGGARKILRQTDVEMAILETARGGLLRRGLGVERADAALITNVAEDHLGDFGSRTVEELLDIKWIVSRAVRESGILVLNADDARLVEKSAGYDGDIVWFSLQERNPVVEGHVACGGSAFITSDDSLVRVADGRREYICRVAEMPIALGGSARHNVANALAAAALTHSLGVDLGDVARGLCSMTQAANPGRSNLYEIDGATVIVDFAHNPHAMQAVFEMASRMPAERRLLAFGQAGDRTDESIRELARSAWQIGLDEVAVSELAKYHRGRAHGEVFGIIRDELVNCGADEARIHHFEEEPDTLEFALEWAQPGDLVIMLALGRAQAIEDRLKGKSA